MPEEPGNTRPVVRRRRPRTSPAVRRLTARQAAGGSEEAGTVAGSDCEEEEPRHELLEYEWPDLPPLPTIKDAVTRSRVSYGISYLLPVDKGRNSINNRFRTDLRAMFQEPYSSDDLNYDDSRVKLSSKVHFLSNTSDTKWTHAHLASVPVNLNWDSEKMRSLYARSAPSGGRASQQMGLDRKKLRTRSTLYLPLKAAVPPELVKLRHEVEAILKSVGEDESDFDELRDTANQQADEDGGGGGRGGGAGPDVNSDPPPPGGLGGETERGSPRGTHGGGAQGVQTLAARLQSIQPYSHRYKSYADLKACKDPRPLIPDCLKSQFLTDQQNQNIWDWLHHGEKMNDFDFFLSVCG